MASGCQSSQCCSVGLRHVSRTTVIQITSPILGPCDTLITDGGNGVRMPSSSDGGYQPSCMLAHQLINRLTVIVGFCDLLEGEALETPECLRRLRQMREIASSAAEELIRHQCRLDAVTQPESSQDAVPSQI